MTPATQALVYRFLLGLVVTEIPVATAVLSNPTPDYRLLAVGLLGGLGAAVEKYLAPFVTGGLQANPAAVNASALPQPPAPVAPPVAPGPPAPQAGPQLPQT